MIMPVRYKLLLVSFIIAIVPALTSLWSREKQSYTSLGCRFLSVYIVSVVMCIVLFTFLKMKECSNLAFPKDMDIDAFPTPMFYH